MPAKDISPCIMDEKCLKIQNAKFGLSTAEENFFGVDFFCARKFSSRDNDYSTKKTPH